MPKRSAKKSTVRKSQPAGAAKATKPQAVEVQISTRQKEQLDLLNATMVMAREKLALYYKACVDGVGIDYNEGALQVSTPRKKGNKWVLLVYVAANDTS